jgi:hypothetical protein
VTETTFGTFTEKGDDPGIEIADALFGPFEFFVNVSKLFGRSAAAVIPYRYLR